MGDISDIKTGPFGSVLHESDYVEIGTPIITVEHLGEIEIEGRNAPKVSDTDKERLGSYILDAGDIVFSRVGSVDRCSIVTKTEKGWLFSGRLLRLRVISTDNSAFFLNQLLKHDPSKAQIRNSAVGQTMASLNTAILKRISLPFPSTPEQQKIAACLSSFDALIAAQADKLDALKTHKKGLMQQLFPCEGETLPRLRFPEFREAGEWEEIPLDDICERIMDGTHFSPKSKSGPYLYLTSKNVRPGFLALDDVSHISEDEHRSIFARCPVKKNDLLLTKDGASTGNCALNPLDFEFSLLSSVAVIRGKDEKILQEFLAHDFQSRHVQDQIFDSIAGQAITRITLEKIKRFKVWLTSSDEQNKIAACLSSLDALITAQAEKLDALKTHKKGLMQQLFPSPEAVSG